MVYLGHYGKWKITVSECTEQKIEKLQSGNISPGKDWATLQDKLFKDAWKEFHDRYVITHGEVRLMVMWHLFANYFMHSLCSANLK